MHPGHPVPWARPFRLMRSMMVQNPFEMPKSAVLMIEIMIPARSSILGPSFLPKYALENCPTMYATR